jgi:membrane fusion protein, heavy metal efflux system
VGSEHKDTPAGSHHPHLRRSAQVGVLCVLALCLAGIAVYVRSGSAPPKEANAPSETAVSGDSFHPTDNQWKGFKIAAVGTARFSAIEETDGRIVLDDDLVTPVYSQYSGRVTQTLVKAGDVVKAGDPLLTVQASEFVQGTNDLIAAAATLKTAQAQLRMNEANEKRQHALFLAHGAAEKDWQQSQVDLATAQGAVNAALVAQAAVRNRLRILGKTDEEIAAIEAAPDLHAFDPIAVLRAPIGGVVTQRQVGVGQNIVSTTAGGSTAQFQIADLSRVWLAANVREEASGRIKRGDTAEVTVPAFPGQVFTARVTYVAPAIDPTTHRLTVRAEIENKDGALRPEMLARFRIATGEAEQSPAIPIGALVYEGSDVHVWQADPDKRTVSLKQIEIGHIDRGMAQVLKGLTTADFVVTSGSLFIDRAVTGD